MSKLIPNDQVVFVDCDQTLVMWPQEFEEPSLNSVELVDPYDKRTVYLTPHKEHIYLVKKYKIQGYFVVVWSAGGSLWAQEVVNKLNLNDSVDLIMSKSIKYVDDLQANEVLGSRVYIPFKG